MKRSIEDTSIVFVGAGRLATNLAKAFYRKGFRIAQVYSRTEASARELARQVEAEYTADLSALKHHARLYVAALTDAALPALIPAMTEGRSQGLWVHTAGSLPLEVWQGHVSRYGVFYPMQTFSKEREVDFSGLPIFIEGSDAAVSAFLKEVAATLSSRVYEAGSVQRGQLHLAAVFACNFTNHMYALAARLLRQGGLPFSVLLPLIDETARKVHELEPQQAQTGPAVRYDRNVMARHLSLLADDSRMQQVYRLLSNSIHEEAAGNGDNPLEQP